MTARRPRPSRLPRLHMERAASPRHRQRGVALLVAILLVALGTIIAAAMAYSNAMTARRAAGNFAFDQALLVAEGAEALAAYGLQQTFQQSPQSIYPGQPWSHPLQPTEVVPGVTLEASLEDLQGRFNINNLVLNNDNDPNMPAIQAFQRLLGILGMNQSWASYIVDWIDKNDIPMTPDGAEDSVYMEVDPPYRTPNLPITSTSELMAMALPGFTRAAFNRLAPYIVALPIGTQVNVCSASPYVLDAIAGHMEYSVDPVQFEKDREDAGTCRPTLRDFQTAAGNIEGGNGQNTGQTLGGLVTQTSAWFRLTSFVNIGSAEFSVYTVLYEGQSGARPVMRSFTPD